MTAMAMMLLAGCEPPPAPSAPVQASAPAPLAAAPACERATKGARVLDEKQLAELRALAVSSGSTGLVVLDHGEVVVEAGNAEKPVHIMSITKSVVSLLIGQLVDEKKLRVDQPVADFVAEWKGSPKAAITVQHLLANTSGLADKPTTEDIYAAGDFVKFALAAELKTPPGQRHLYSNSAANLIPHVAKLASGVPLNEWAQRSLFSPLGLQNVEWDLDKAGNVQGMSGIRMSARDLAAIGDLVIDGGRHCGKQLVSAAWLQESTAPQSSGFRPHGYLWWLTPESSKIGFSAKLLDDWKASGAPLDFIEKFRPLVGQYFDRADFFRAINRALNGKDEKPSDSDVALWHETTWKAKRPDGEIQLGPIRTIVGDGYGGQALLIYPAKGVVVARLRDMSNGEPAKEKTDVAKAIDEIVVPKPAP